MNKRMRARARARVCVFTRARSCRK